MQTSVLKLVGQPVLVKNQTVGTIAQVAFDLAKGTVLGLLVKPTTGRDLKIVYRDSVIDVGEGGLGIQQKNQLEEVTPGSLADQAQKADKQIIDLPALTESGQEFGTVRDVILQTPLLSPIQFVVQDEGGERLIPKDQVKEITLGAVIFFETVVKGHLNWQTGIETDTAGI